jgi:hypothetical protein
MGAWGFAGIGVSVEVVSDLGIVATPVSMTSLRLRHLFATGIMRRQESTSC